MIPVIQFTDDGLIAPPREEITAALWDMMRTAFSDARDPIAEDPRTPQGQLVTSLTAAIENQNNAMIEMGNNFDPRYSFGPWQEALAAIYFLSRKLATSSVAQLSFVGLPGTVIPDGYLILDDAGKEWAVSPAYTVGAGLVTAICTTSGPIQAAPNTITTFKETIDGLDTVTNPEAAAVGSVEETRANFEDRRYNSVAANSKNMNQSVFGAVFNLPGVIDVFVQDNPTDATITIGETNYPLIRNSLLCSVVGGDSYDIAEQVLIKGGTGCSFVGNTEVLYLDTESGNAFPPEYLVKFLRPTHITTYIRLTVADPSAISFANTEAAKQSIVTAFQSGANRARIGGIVIGSDYQCGLDTAAIRPVKIELSTDELAWFEYIRFGVDQFPVTSTANVSLAGI